MENYAELMFQGKTKQLQKAGVIYDKNIELYQRRVVARLGVEEIECSYPQMKVFI